MALSSVLGCAESAVPGATLTTLADGLVSPTGIAVLADGTLLVAESAAGRITAVTSDGATSTFVDGFKVGTFFPYDIGPLSLAVRADGTIFVGEAGGIIGAERIAIYSAEGVEDADAALVPILGSNFNAVALHPANGDLYAASAGSDRIIRARAAGEGVYLAPEDFIERTNNPPIGYFAPAALAFESTGDLLAGFADFGGGAILRLTTEDESATPPETLYTTGQVITAVAVRPSDGIVFFTEASYAANQLGTGRVAMLQTSEDGEVSAETFVDGLAGPAALAFGAGDVLYIALLGDTPNAAGGSIMRAGEPDSDPAGVDNENASSDDDDSSEEAQDADES